MITNVTNDTKLDRVCLYSLNSLVFVLFVSVNIRVIRCHSTFVLGFSKLFQTHWAESEILTKWKSWLFYD